MCKMAEFNLTQRNVNLRMRSELYTQKKTNKVVNVTIRFLIHMCMNMIKKNLS